MVPGEPCERRACRSISSGIGHPLWLHVMCHVNGRAQGNVRPHPLAREVAAVAAARSVAKPPVSLQVGLYNIGWTDSQLSGQNHEMHRKQLGRDCAGAFEFNDLGMRCLCEYGGQNVNRWLEQVIHECCKTSIDLQAYVLGPYAIVLDKSVCCFETSPRLRGPLVTYPGTDHTYRRAVHSVIQVLSHGPRKRSHPATTTT